MWKPTHFRKKYITLNLIIVLLRLRHVNFYYWSISGLYRFLLSQEIPYKPTNKPTYTRELKKTHSVIFTWIFTIVLFQKCIVFSLVRKSRTNQPTYIIICVNKKHTPPSPRGFLLLICLCRMCRTNQPTYICVNNKRKHIPSSSRRLIYSRPLSFFVGSGGSALTK